MKKNIIIIKKEKSKFNKDILQNSKFLLLNKENLIFVKE